MPVVMTARMVEGSAGAAAVVRPLSPKKEKKLPPVVRSHDWFNLAFLGVLNVLNVIYLATGGFFNVFYFATMLYFVADLIYVGVVPRCVKSPMVILAHHVITAAYALIPYHFPQYEFCMSWAMLVEINTWLLIAKRTFPHTRLLELAFYASWVLLRNVFYPYLIFAFAREWQVEWVASGSPWNWILVAPVFQVFLTALNFKWTAELFFRASPKERQLKQL